MANKEKWWIAFNLLSKGLNNFYEIHDTQSGQKLYDRLISSDKFKDENNWIFKFEKEFGVKSVDPIHLFSSINSNKLNPENRVKRIKILLNLLTIDYSFDDVDFTGCPTPVTVNLIGVRKEEYQEEIWGIFQQITVEKSKEQLKRTFNAYEKWYGVAFESFTIFLFWVRSDWYLPLDKHTSTFLVSSSIIEEKPKNISSYLRMLIPFRKSNKNYEQNDVYFEKGLLREIAHVAYHITTSKDSFKWTQHFHQFYNSLSPSSFLTEEEVQISTEIGFKIIAIQTHPDCDEHYLNNLSKENEIFYFEKAFKISSDKIEISYNPAKNPQLYGKDENKSINITAIVGQNGSGKSSLIELLFRAINVLAFKHKNKLKTKDLTAITDLFVSLYYIVNGKLFRLDIQGEDISLDRYTFKNNTFNFTSSSAFGYSDFQDFFYSVAINYSHYALNNYQIGDWINGLFHKNDSYQTPLVINPMRTNGNIDINVENQLSRARLMANLFEVTEEDSIGIRRIAEDKEAFKIKFKLNKKKSKRLFVKKNGKDWKDVLLNKLKDKRAIFNSVKSTFEFPTSFKLGDSIIKKEARDYILRKLVRISITYPYYKKYFNKVEVEFDQDLLAEYLRKIKTDNSHVTYKLKQTINYLRYEDLTPKMDEFEFVIKEQSEIYQNFKSKVDNAPILQLLPPPIFKAKIIVLNTQDKSESNFDKLSSGEKQLIYSINSMLYHLKNLDSVNNAQTNLISYSNINFLLDEIEIYYHPELQRKYLSYLLNAINQLPLTEIQNINICLVTHSPYILSDIPDCFTLKLENGKPNNQVLKSFGANVYDLLADGFFMKDGFIGEVAIKHIHSIIDYSKDDKQEYNFTKHQTFEKNVALIGDEIVSTKLKKMLGEKYERNFNTNEAKLEQLKQQQAEIAKKIKKLEDND